ncbi:hypothetical protein TELCIR_12504, partial [Teladorsagia circumcincta]
MAAADHLCGHVRVRERRETLNSERRPNGHTSSVQTTMDRMSSQVGAIASVNNLISKVFKQPKGDFADRLNSRITVCLLALSSVLLLSSHYMGDPITCWTPAQFTKQCIWPLIDNRSCSNEANSGLGYDLAGAIQYVDAFWTTVKTNDVTFKARIAAFEGRASAYIWDGLRLARNKNSQEMALYYTVSTVIQTINAWLQSPLYTLWGPALIHDLIRGDDWQ